MILTSNYHVINELINTINECFYLFFLVNLWRLFLKLFAKFIGIIFLFLVSQKMQILKGGLNKSVGDTNSVATKIKIESDYTLVPSNFKKKTRCFWPMTPLNSATDLLDLSQQLKFNDCIEKGKNIKKIQKIYYQFIQ